MQKIFFFALTIFTASSLATFDSADWTQNALIKKGETRANIYKLSEEELLETKEAGIIHALRYPVTVTGLLIPYEPMKNFFNESEDKGLKKFLAKVGQKLVGFSDEKGMYEWLGLNKYNDENATGIYKIPYPDGHRPDYYMGASIIETKWGKGLTYSCATCHSASLFGRSVMGLTNKRPRANRYFVMAKKIVPMIPTHMFANLTGATDEEAMMFRRTKKNLPSVGAKTPQALGLDTSLPQVALSLSKRGMDEHASKSRFFEFAPRPNALKTKIADSKPMPWWNLKYKTRWLSDGSIVEGNPILTNFLWNEIGRGTDLKELEKWMQENQETIRELTVAAFATEAPKYWDFFPAKNIDIEMAKRGEKIFQNSCAKCHGDYEKGWSNEDADSLSYIEKLTTTKVLYHEKTPVKDVGTDPGRYEGTKSFADALNKLSISKWMKTVVVPQKGYVPPPLVGIWSRWPYLHNNSIPNLCELLTHPDKRVKTFYQGPAVNAQTDFDDECVGYPTGDKIPKAWKKDKDAFYDTRNEGMRNIGHSKAFIGEKGEELLTKEQKRELIMFLKTL